MKKFEQVFEGACSAQEIAGATLMAADRSGGFNYARAFGKRSVKAGGDQSPLSFDGVMWLASCTKLVTSIAVMQCVERGLLTLDAPVYDILPELKDHLVIRRIEDDGKPIVEPHTKTITLRNLLNHSSGFAYELDPRLLAWHAYNKSRPGGGDATVIGQYSAPLVFEPGDSWSYGPSTDWAGLMVERVTGMNLQEYFEKNIFVHVGARDLVFSSMIKSRPDMVERMVDVSERDPENPKKVRHSEEKMLYNRHGACLGGSGLFASSTDYFKILKGVLTTEQDEKLLKKESVELFFKPSLTEKARKALNKALSIQEARNGMGAFPSDITLDWGLGGILNEQDVPGGRKAGSMTWGGLPNLVWSVDRKGGVCGFLGGQLVPPADAQIADLWRGWEAGFYELLREKNSKL